MVDLKLPVSGRHHPTHKWGPAMWTTLHMASLNYRATDKNKRAWKSMLKDWVPLALPCEKCRKHYMDKLPSFKFQQILRSRRSLIVFLYLLHNQISLEVDRALGKRHVPFSWAQFLNKFSP